MTDELCQMCKEEGVPNRLAHYKSVPAGRSHNGKAQPALCYNHKHGKNPISIPNVEVETFDGQHGPEPLDIDVERALKLRDKGYTWTQVADELGVAQHRVYSQCRKLDRQVKGSTKWEEVFKQIAPIDLGASITVKFPIGGTRMQLNSVANMNKLVAKWKWSFKDNFDGTVTCTKVGTWATFDEMMLSKKEIEVTDEMVEQEVVMSLEDKGHVLAEKALDLVKTSREIIIEAPPTHEEPVNGNTRVTIYKGNSKLVVEGITFEQLKELVACHA